MFDKSFRKIIWDHFRTEGRDLPWRRTADPYRVLVSEIMLQQTQVARVVPKYTEFVKRFPTFRALAKAPVRAVLSLWQGLGYNRRALMLQRCAQAIVADAPGPLPGVGPYTAGAVLAFAFNKPAVIIETNIRRVYLHHYFPGRRDISDRQLLPIIERTLDQKRPRQWYWALMDYGAYLATQIENPNRRSRHYSKQSTFEGSNRQLRGRVLRALLAGKPLPPGARTRKIALQLQKEGFQ